LPGPVLFARAVCGAAATARATSTGPGKAEPGSEEFADSIKQMMGAPKGAMVVRGADVYWTTLDGQLWRAPMTGGTATKVIDTMTDGLAADDRGLYYAERDGLYLLPLEPAGQKPIRISPLAKALLVASDADTLYCVVPNFSFDPTPKYGVYRVDKRGGEAVLIWRPSAPRDEPELAVEGADIYVASAASGIIYRFDKAGGKPTTLVRGQRRVDAIAVDATHVYWHIEGGEVRRSPRTGGGKIEVLARKVDGGRLVAHKSGVYWFEGGPGRTGYRLMRVSPGASAAVPVAQDLNMPAGLTVDDFRTVYIGDVVRRAIVRLPLSRR